MAKDQSGKEIADMLCNMPHEKLLEVVQNCPAIMLQQFVPNVSAAGAPTVVSIPASSSGWGGNQAKKACSFKVSVFGSHVGPGSAKTDSFLCPPPTATSCVVAGAGTTQAGFPVVSAPGVVPVSF